MAAALGLYAHSFHKLAGFGLAAGILSFCLAFLPYPNFFYAVYMLFFVHPKVEKTFNQPLLSDRWGLFEQNPDLAEQFFGPDPVKRPIQYEEVFPQSK
jgi:hypothetical protein